MVETLYFKKTAGSDLQLTLPKYETVGSSGLDLRADLPHSLRKSGLILKVLSRKLVATGLTVQIPTDSEGQIRPRSGLALKYGITLVNSPGTIDSDYRGELKVLLINLGSEPYIVEHGSRIAQLVISPVMKVKVVEIEHFDWSPRGDEGFGSTGTE